MTIARTLDADRCSRCGRQDPPTTCSCGHSPDLDAVRRRGPRAGTGPTGAAERAALELARRQRFVASLGATLDNARARGSR